MRKLYVEAAGDPKWALSDEQLSESLTATIKARPKGAGWWVFAYGSLLWNPLFPFAECRPAMLRGLHRRFCLYSLATRGTPEQPGLVLGLDRGGACTGVAYRLPAPVAMDELHLLWRREMVTSAYIPRWVDLFDGAGERFGAGLAFTIDQTSAQYVGALPDNEIVRRLATAKGSLGSAADYLFQTRDGLREHGIPDADLERLARGVEGILEG